MKKHLFLFLVLFVQVLHSQNQSVQNDTVLLRSRNEIRLDIGKLLISGRLKVAYERFLNKDFSVGTSIMYYGEHYRDNIFDNSNSEKKFEIEPFVRYALSENAEHFFYVEMFSSICSGKYREIDRLSDGGYAYYDWKKSNFTTVAAGMAIGYKFYVKEHFCMDFNFGLSSTLYNKRDTETLPKFGINLGYRF